MLNEKEIISKCKEVCARAGYDFNIPVRINKRLTTTLGRVKYFKCGSSAYNDSMEFSFQFLNTATDKQIQDVIEHECAHYLVTESTKQVHHHDATFKAMCAKIGCTNNMAIYHNFESDKKSFKYSVICKNCGRSLGGYYRAGKVVKNPASVCCKFCEGEIEIIQNY